MTPASPRPAPALGPWPRGLSRGLSLAALVSLAACTTPAPAPALLYLPARAAMAMAEPAPPPAPTAAEWRLDPAVELPAALDREAVMVAVAPGQWRPWQGLRWAEPLRDSVPRVLRTDLDALMAARGYRLQTGPRSPGLPPAHTLRIEIDDWEASLPQRQLSLRAHWTLTTPPPPTGAVSTPATRRGELGLLTPWPQATAEGLVRAQRALLRQLAQGVADGIASAPAP